VELWVNFADSFTEINEYFLTFPLDKIAVGIEFASDRDASAFKDLVN